MSQKVSGFQTTVGWVFLCELCLCLFFTITQPCFFSAATVHVRVGIGMSVVCFLPSVIWDRLQPPWDINWKYEWAINLAIAINPFMAQKPPGCLIKLNWWLLCYYYYYYTHLFITKIIQMKILESQISLLSFPL